MEQTVEQKLKALWALQTVHTKIDKIRQVRGELPIEVADLEDDIAGLDTRIEKIRTELDDLEDSIVKRKNMIKDAQTAIKKYEGQLGEVKNNREYDAISKEIEIQGLEIQVCEKRIREAEFEIKNKTEVYDKTLKNLEFSKSELELKKQELETITGETQKEEDALLAVTEKSEKKIEDRLLKVYNKLRNSFRNGLAVVSIERDSCSGCFNKIPPQLQSEIRQRKKIIICEHCGRVIVDEGIVFEEEHG
ncbi:C4-type zinc ribbon domain-containing protein [Sphingobacterium sp. UT-1RO-CII-1]|uniref:zinc ribbon domain-containing protein n=1 Tax=Sphingobacterium sp. UT-1RO-CII-1 TaxID=2995225 RepID=UPI00227CB7D5|nr:C4-type zinc ribbon domain-containing protein [Sphingobacterium sp. UT-1RO-CII-1]MCY4778734.1 C4-type zinc ribbon domain-containing protein [Sphingobacterium sp. UT-1RO-CII-1]